MLEIKEILEKIAENKKRSSKEYYHPLPKQESILIRKYFADHILIPISGDPVMEIFNKENTLISKGYERIVIGDYGPFLEFTAQQAVLANLVNHFPGAPRRKVKYIWMETKDKTRTKVYFQQGRVSYADYKIGRYYVDSFEVLYKE